MDSTNPALKPPTAAVAAAVSLPLNGLNVIGQFQDTRADERLRRVSAVGFLHVSGGKIQHVPVAPNGLLAWTVRPNGGSAINYSSLD
jgi:hypothetical protein